MTIDTTRWRHAALRLLGAAALATVATACGGGASRAGAAPANIGLGVSKADPARLADASRLADQASFGANEALLGDIMATGPAGWIAGQMSLDVSRYTRGGTDAIHKTTATDFCTANRLGASCWRDYYSHEPLANDFFRNAILNPDQLRQRMALALQQILVVSSLEVEGTYGLRQWHNQFLVNAFGNYRQVLQDVALSPLMGDYLNNVNNKAAQPNENFARELMQLFSVGTCELNLDGSLKGGTCQPTYGNTTVREYAYALTGWGYPAGGFSAWCNAPDGSCRYYGGDMQPRPALHDTQSRLLLSGVTVPAGSTPAQALSLVLDSLMAHPNTAPFVSRQLIQRLVGSHPSPAYVQRVASAFNAGRFSEGTATFGGGAKGDLKAVVAAILLDPEARASAATQASGRLREPVLYFTHVLRALNGKSDGQSLTWWWGNDLGQHVLRPASVFNFYPPDFPVPGTGGLQGPEFAILGTSSSLARLNFINYLVYWGGSQPMAGFTDALGTQVDLKPFEVDADNPAALVDRLLRLAVGGRITPSARNTIIQAVSAWAPVHGAQYRSERVKAAAYLVFAAPQYQVAR